MAALRGHGGRARGSGCSLHVPTDPSEVAPASTCTHELFDLDDRQLHSAETRCPARSDAAGRRRLPRDRNLRAHGPAMRTRAVIEQAKGILMADERIGDEQAFERLVSLSQHANIKVRDVARRLVDERSRPE